MSRSPQVLSLFAGCGGSSLGYKLAGCKVLAAVERDPHAVPLIKQIIPVPCCWMGILQD